jgi:antitoxin ParD1/3/4
MMGQQEKKAKKRPCLVNEAVNYCQFLTTALFLKYVVETGGHMTMNVNLSPQLEDMVRQKVTSGLYTSASEVVRDALRLMEEKDQLRAIKLEQLRQDIKDGLNSGEPTPWDVEEIKREGRARLIAKTTGGP